MLSLSIKIFIGAYLCSALLLRVTWAQSALPPDVLQALVESDIPPENVSVVVAPLLPPPGMTVPAQTTNPPSGDANAEVTPQPQLKPRLSWQADVPRNPASVMKLVTTYAGLDLLGPAYFWKTRVFTSGYIKDGILHGNLLIQGSGDPKLVRERIEMLMAAIQKHGVRRIDGDILLDNSIFSLPEHDPAAFDDEPLRPYNVGPDGLLVNFKTLVLNFIPTPSGKNVTVQSEPPIAHVAIPAVVPTVRGDCGDWRARLAPDFTDPNQVRFTGRYPLRCGEKTLTVAYIEPRSYAPRVIEAMWHAAGGELTGQVRWLSGATYGQPLVTAYSLPLVEIIQDINKFSNNVMAQQLFLTLSAAGNRHGSFAESRNLLTRWWHEHFGLSTAPVMDNGAGLTRVGRITAASLTALLQHAATNAHAAEFEQSLPIAGIDGTIRALAKRNPASEAIGRARLKTGTLRDVSAIAGYAWGLSGRKYVVVGLINDPNAPAARAALDKLVEWAVRDQP